MKLTLNSKVLKKWNVCANDLKNFRDMHGDKTVSLKDALESNGIRDFLGIFFDNKENFAESQIRDMKLLLCNYTEHVLYIYEERYPGSKSPRICIEIAKKYINGTCSIADVKVGKVNADKAYADAAYADAVYAYAPAVVDVATDAIGMNYADVAIDASYAAGAYATTTTDARENEINWQKQELIKLIEKWESTRRFCVNLINRSVRSTFL